MRTTETRTNGTINTNTANVMEEKEMTENRVSGTVNNYSVSDNNGYTFVETYNITNPIGWQVDEMLSKANIGLQLLNKSSRYCEALLGIGTPYERTETYLYIIQDVLNKGFRISNLTDMINKIYDYAYSNDIDILDIDISDTNVNDICIFFDVQLDIRKNDNDGGVHLTLHYYNGEIQFIDANVYNYSTNRTRYGCTLERLKEVLNNFGIQGD